jgi:hypothetical protein
MYTMNVPSDAMYKALLTDHQQNFSMLLGKTEVMTAVDTMQFDDYALYASEIFDGEAMRLRKETEFPKDCARAYELGKKLTS